MLSHRIRMTAMVAIALSGAAEFADAQILTSVETAKKTATATGRPILAIAGKKT